MEKLNMNIHEGIKEYCFADDENAVIRINTADHNLFPRMKKGRAAINALAEKLEKENTNDFDTVCDRIEELDSGIKAQIDYIFGSGVSKTAFGGTSCTTLINGVPRFQLFLEAIFPVIERDILAEQKKSEEKIAAYTQQRVE